MITWLGKFVHVNLKTLDKLLKAVASELSYYKFIEVVANSKFDKFGFKNCIILFLGVIADLKIVSLPTDSLKCLICTDTVQYQYQSRYLLCSP